MPQIKEELYIEVSNELILTPLTAASLVNEIIKGLLYHKCQIPFPFTWLKQVVEKRRKKLNSEETGLKKVNFTHENHYRIVSSAYDHLNTLIKGINKEFCENENVVKEIVVIFGPSPNCPKEVITVVIPSIAKGHIERNHMQQLNTHLQKVLRNIFLSQTWMDSIDASIPCTNTYVYIRKEGQQADNNKTEEKTTSELFERSQPPQIPTNIKHSKCVIVYNPSERTNCCDGLLIFGEESTNNDSRQLAESTLSSIEQPQLWFRAKGLLKGFKDSFINKVSVCELW